ncbi:MAG TPA: SDR family NAD(P)-dependent oxidoreductase [Gemmatimonadaceae bacterium]|jgi:NADP-dependent 3-hydroxy acid dehydrogenase YdfG|nr:SDR family NAD(P)-dependent oxidoreductase [Gemmatimonadaceae bacterium]
MPVTLVTGASRGIGRAISLRLAREGHEIVAAARNFAELDALCAEIRSAGGRARPLVLDVADPAAVASALAGVRVDVLVNNAGIGKLKPFMDTTPDEWRAMIDVNVNALYHVTRAVLPEMIANGSGHVCTIGSISGRSAFPGGSCYAATKAFVTTWAESLLLEVREHGVKVSVVMPGSVATSFSGRDPQPEDAWKLSPEDVADTVAYVVGTPPNVLVHRAEVRTLSSPPKKSPR